MSSIPSQKANDRGQFAKVPQGGYDAFTNDMLGMLNEMHEKMTLAGKRKPTNA